MAYTAKVTGDYRSKRAVIYNDEEEPIATLRVSSSLRRLRDGKVREPKSVATITIGPNTYHINKNLLVTETTTHVLDPKDHLAKRLRSDGHFEDLISTLEEMIRQELTKTPKKLR